MYHGQWALRSRQGTVCLRHGLRIVRETRETDPAEMMRRLHVSQVVECLALECMKSLLLAVASRFLADSVVAYVTPRSVNAQSCHYGRLSAGQERRRMEGRMWVREHRHRGRGFPKVLRHGAKFHREVRLARGHPWYSCSARWHWGTPENWELSVACVFVSVHRQSCFPACSKVSIVPLCVFPLLRC
jgi:hypothetical protein